MKEKTKTTIVFVGLKFLELIGLILVTSLIYILGSLDYYYFHWVANNSGTFWNIISAGLVYVMGGVLIAMMILVVIMLGHTFFVLNWKWAKKISKKL